MLHDPDRNAIASGTLKRAPVMIWRVSFHLREPHLRTAVRAFRMEDAPWNDFGFRHSGETAPQLSTQSRCACYRRRRPGNLGEILDFLLCQS
jgi:hypothetical protein